MPMSRAVMASTWWQLAEGDRQPTLTSRFPAPTTIFAVRLIWRDVGMDTNHSVKPGPFRYRAELETGKGYWTTILDRSNSMDDLLVDCRECRPTVGRRAACHPRLAQRHHARCGGVYGLWQDGRQERFCWKADGIRITEVIPVTALLRAPLARAYPSKREHI